MTDAYPTIRRAFSEFMVASYGPDWEVQLRAKQKLALEDAYIAGVQTCVILICSGDDPGSNLERIDAELKEFGKVIVQRYADAGLPTGY